MPADLVTRDVILRIFLGTPAPQMPTFESRIPAPLVTLAGTRYRRADVRARVPGYDWDRAIMSRRRCPRSREQLRPAHYELHVTESRIHKPLYRCIGAAFSETKQTVSR
jgi:hypothetical protein